MFQRSQVATLVERILEPPERIVAIFGPRQTGKTTVARQALEVLSKNHQVQYAYVPVDKPGVQDALDPLTVSHDVSAHPGGVMAGDVAGLPGLSVPGHATALSSTAARDTHWLVEVWRDSRRQAQNSRNGFVLVLDEIQKIERWSETVKGLWDADRFEGLCMHVVILGSAPLLMQAGLTESLAGRFEPIRVTHWSYPEMSQAFGFDLDQYIYFGGYPGAASASLAGREAHNSERWAAYVREALVEPNIERDVLSMERIGKPALLRRLFEMGAKYSGQILSYEKMLGQLHESGNITTLAHYLELLSKAGLLTGLPRHDKRPVSPRASTPKLNVLNTALMAMASGYTFEDARAEREFWGRMTESAVGAHLCNTVSARTEVRYWRSDSSGRGSFEVDFVLRRGPNTIGIEVKSGRPRPSSAARGLQEFKQRFGAVTTVLVGTAGVPMEEFLSHPADHWFTASEKPSTGIGVP